jgi:hypothetical protein
VIRGVTMAVGLAITAYGAWLLLALGWDNLTATASWLVGGVVVHDAILAPLTIGLALVAVRVVRRDRLGPWAVALVVLAPVTLLSVPVLGRFGARSSEPSLLDRHYWLGWFALVVVVGLAILVATYADRSHRRTGAAEGGDDGQGHGRR